MIVRSTPAVGDVVDYFFLWADEQAAGQVEGRKSRPCIIVAVRDQLGDAQPRVMVLPITGSAPRAGTTAVAVPNHVKSRMGLDVVRPAWVVIDDANLFTWPGFDLVPQPEGGFVRGVVTAGLFEQVRKAFLDVRARGRTRRIERDNA
jgi:hypothetical protein